jgi:hypothetical protein
MARKKQPAPPEPAEAAAPVAFAQAAVTRTIDLAPADWFRATWRKLPPLPKPARDVPPFDLDACLANLGQLKQSAYGWWEWRKLKVLPDLSPAEARFWFTAFTSLKQGDSAVQRHTLAGKLSRNDFSPPLPLEEVKQRLATVDRGVPMDALLRFLTAFLPPADFLELIQDGAAMRGSWDTATHALRWFISGALPYLPAGELAKLQPSLREHLKSQSWPTDYYQRPAMAYFLAALAGLHDELLAVVRAWPDDSYGRQDWDDYYHQPQLVVFGLGSAELVSRTMRRLKLRLKTPEHARAWLAHTEFADLDYLRDAVLRTTNKQDADRLLEVLCLVKAPEAAPHLLELRLGSKVPKRAGEWLDTQVGNAVAGLLPTAAGRGRLADAAVEYLREARRKGYTALIEEQLRAAAPEVAAKVRRDVLEHVEKTYPVLDDKHTPRPLRTALAEAPAERLPEWVLGAPLPPLVVGGHRLSDDSAKAVLRALKGSTLEAPQPLLASLRQKADRASLDTFAWRLFEEWLAEGAPSKDKWAFRALGHFGGDASALRLTPLVRAWPGESQHQRAVLGLECLRAIGSDTALMQLNGIAQKLKFQALKKKAQEAMEAVARDRGLTRDELEDRIVPDLDLDERGSRVFDFGPRQFRVVLGPALSPLVRDEEGKAKADLPKPGARDDPDRAAAAVAAWKLLKKQLREALKVQVPRLEQAMITGRRWTVDPFEALLVHHPLMTHLTRRLLWGGYDAKGQLMATFRVTEEQEYADVEDQPCRLSGLASVGVVHPLHLTEAQRTAWGHVFGEYEIISPFPQLGRPVYALQRAEEKATEITRFRGPAIPALALFGTLEKLGWVRGAPEDAGFVHQHFKPFPGGDVLAVLCYENGVPVGYREGWDDQHISSTYFLERADSGAYHRGGKKVTLGKVDPVVVSEVLADLTTLASKGK